MLHSSLKHALSIQTGDGSFPPGHNGPYHDPETPVRNTAHWLFALASMYEKTREARWRDAGTKAVEYLMSSNARPHGKTFHCRNKKGKDKCNGLIGQAWVIEALVQAGRVFDRQDCYQLAEKVFRLHPWDRNIGIWQRVEIDGTILSFDRTFNHQLWFAAAGSMLKKTKEAQIRARFFLEKIAGKVHLYANGIVFHQSPMGRFHSYLKKGIKPVAIELKFRLENQLVKKSLFSKSAGYHGFNLYAFSILKKTFPDAEIWKCKKFKALITAHRNENFILNLEKSEFSYRYNLSGIEVAFAEETFFKNREEVILWINRQLKETYLEKANPLSRNVSDPNTADARIYEAARFVGDYGVSHG